jgi:hypothetical protein
MFTLLPVNGGALDSVVGWGTMLQAGRSPVRVPDEVDFFFNLPYSSSRIMALGSTQPLTEINTRNLLGGKKAAGAWGWQSLSHLWAECLKMWEPQPPTTLRTSTAYTGIALFYCQLMATIWTKVQQRLIFICWNSPPQKLVLKYTALGHRFVRLCCRSTQPPGTLIYVAWNTVIKGRRFLFLSIETCIILRVILWWEPLE